MLGLCSFLLEIKVNLWFTKMIKINPTIIYENLSPTHYYFMVSKNQKLFCRYNGSYSNHFKSKDFSLTPCCDSFRTNLFSY